MSMDNKSIIRRLEELDKISIILDPDEAQRKSMTTTVMDYANQFIEGLPTVRSFTQKQPKNIAITEEQHTLQQLMDIYQYNVAESGINAASGGHLGYIPGGGIYASGLADYLAAITNPYAGVYFASPGAVAIENEVIHWLKDLFNFPASATGNLTSGGSVSTLIAFTAARDRYGIKNGRVQGSVIYMSEQVHHSTQKALRIIGLEDAIIRYVPLDEHHRMKTSALEEMIQKDISLRLYPFMVVATAGTTDTGAVDPLDAIADIAHSYNLWFHVDGAYGGFFIMTSKSHLFKGIEKADSLIVDPHKSLFLPYGLGAVLIKDYEAVLHSNQYAASYMQDAMSDDLLKNPSNVSPELTKHFRGLRMWLPLQLYGQAPFIACLEEKLLLTTYFRNRLLEIGFNVGPEPDLSVSYFWYPFEADSDTKNKQLMDAIHSDGDIFLSSSIIDHRFVIRMAILAFRTKRHTIDRAVCMIERSLKAIQ
ncbi:MAG: aminotransferase class V-fold PLP-dependent enzyme [Saprospiraceae bacterium]|nr:MAG: aromatic-L-amino-acid decarboxylase [Bacteroidetes bacterium OLB9]MCO6462510.1 aminotransferase class V-fold PLP-dependent enzyme [Saprospiraceae bacterium]